MTDAVSFVGGIGCSANPKALVAEAWTWRSGSALRRVRTFVPVDAARGQTRIPSVP